MSPIAEPGGRREPVTTISSASSSSAAGAARGVRGGGAGRCAAGLGEAAIGGPDLFETGIDLELQHIERPHLVAAAAAVAGAAPAIMVGLAEGVGVALLVGFARRRVLRAQPFEIIPVAIIFGGVAL